MFRPIFALALFGSTSLACGPDFPNAYLANSSAELSTLPALSFERELMRITGRPHAVRADTADRALAAERAEIAFVLKSAGWRQAAIEKALTSYRRDAPPAELPEEFQLYARASRAWREHRIADAITAWKELLALPPAERQFRTTWALYMIGRALCDTQPAEAIDAFQKLRGAVRDGFADSQNLTADCIGWEARANLRQRDYPKAVRGYLLQFAAGEPSAEASLQITLVHAFRGGDEAVNAMASSQTPTGAEPADPASDDALRMLAADATTRVVVTAWFAARGGPALRWSQDAVEDFRRWLAALATASDQISPDEAGRAAWAAYQNGCWKEAKALVDRAPEDAPASEWVRAMLLLRSGFVAEAAGHLSAAARAFEQDPALNPEESADWRKREQQPFADPPRRQLQGVRGVLALGRAHYAESLRLFLSTGHWIDAAYVAERVLTIEELIAFVRKEAPDDDPQSPEEHRKLRHLLARRLVRAGRTVEARDYFPRELQPDFARYVAALRVGFDPAVSAVKRADALWTAAQLEREKGMLLRGTELEPDYFVWDGDFEWPHLPTTRHEIYVGDGHAGVSPSSDEELRVADARVPQKRFHYRYRAAELAALAAGLRPNDDELTAQILNTAGTWIAHRDPDAANGYFHTLIVRCPNTEIGRRAAAKHWFIWPPSP